MIGAIFGDIVGSTYEFNSTKEYDFQLLTRFSRPTDDTYMTLAVAKALMETYGQNDDAICSALVRRMQEIGNQYPRAGYGAMFYMWLHDPDPQPYKSFGNGSAMRVSPVGWLYPTLDQTLHAARLTAEVTHNHPEGIKGAQAIAAAIFLARAGENKEQILSYIKKQFGYNLDRTLDEIRPDYSFDVTCQGSVPESIIAFMEGETYLDVVRKAVSLGGDSDTMGCMAGGIAEAFYGMPEKYKDKALAKLDNRAREIIYEFKDFTKSIPERGVAEPLIAYP